jgi:hypothetical protein
VGQKGADLGGPHVFGVAFVVKEDKTFDPTEIGDFRTVAHMFEP